MSLGLNPAFFFSSAELDLQNFQWVLQNEWSLDNKGIKVNNLGQENMYKDRG